MDINQNKLTPFQRILIVIYIIAIPIPFGICFLILLYAILYYVFNIPLKRERELLQFVIKKTLNYFKQNKK